MPPRVTFIRLAALLGVTFAAYAASTLVASDGATRAARSPAASVTRAGMPSPNVRPTAAASRSGATPTLLPIPGQPTVEPPLRGAAGTPCEVEIFHDVVAMGFGT